MKEYVTYNWDEDGYPVREGELEEYEEEWEEEDEEYEHQYSPIQGNLDWREYEDLDGFQRITRRTKSVVANEEAKQRNRKSIKNKRRQEAQAKEKYRKQYYHYGDIDE